MKANGRSKLPESPIAAGASCGAGHDYSDRVAILGTSPVLLLEGLFRARSGQRVLFLEANDELGGAWAATGAFGLRDVEGACHLMVNYRGVYEFLSEYCGIPMEICRPEPVVWRNGAFSPFNTSLDVLRRSLGLAARLAAVALIRGIEWLSGNRWRFGGTRDFSFQRTARNLLKRRLHPFLASAAKRAICYPVGGSPAMLRQLREELERLGAQFHAAEAKSLLVREDGVEIGFENAESIRVRRLVTSESCAVACVRTEEASRHFAIRRRTHPVLVMKVDLDSAILSYAEFPFDPLIERAADVTGYCRGELGPHTRILICEPSVPVGEDGSLPLPDEVMDHLKSKGLLPESARVRAHVYREIQLRAGEGALVDYLKSLSGGKGKSVQVVSSRDDFSYSIHRNRRRWARMTGRKSFEDSGVPLATGSTANRFARSG